MTSSTETTLERRAVCRHGPERADKSARYAMTGSKVAVRRHETVVTACVELKLDAYVF